MMELTDRPFGVGPFILGLGTSIPSRELLKTKLACQSASSTFLHAIVQDVPASLPTLPLLGPAAGLGEGIA